MSDDGPAPDRGDDRRRSRPLVPFDLRQAPGDGRARSTERVFGPAAKPIGTLWKSLLVMQLCALSIAIAALVAELMLRTRAADFLAGRLTEDQFKDRTNAFGAVSQIGVAIALGQLVLQVVLSYRIAKNLQGMERPRLRWKPWTAILVWPLGFVTRGLVIFLMLGEHWKASDPEVEPLDESWKLGRLPSPLLVWFGLALAQWGLVIVAALVSHHGSFLATDVSFGSTAAEFADTLTHRLALLVTSALVSFASAIALIVTIQRLTVRHQAFTHAG
jgi:hypothetical protein